MRSNSPPCPVSQSTTWQTLRPFSSTVLTAGDRLMAGKLRAGYGKLVFTAFAGTVFRRDCCVALACLDVSNTVASVFRAASPVPEGTADRMADKRNDKLGWIPAHHDFSVVSGMMVMGAYASTPGYLDTSIQLSRRLRVSRHPADHLPLKPA